MILMMGDDAVKSACRRLAPYVSAVLAVILVMLTVAAFTGQWPLRRNPYNSYVLQACAWLDGRLDLGRDYTWLELAIYNEKYYVSFPPFPSYIMLPFAALMREQTPDGAIAWAVTVLGALYAMRLYELTRRDRRGLFWVLFLYLGTGYLFISMNGYVWFIAQTMCFTLSLMALVHAKQGQGGVALACWACSVGCRPMMALYLPVLVWVLWQHKGSLSFWQWVRKRWYWAVPTLVIAASYMALNYARFGNPIEFGHNYLPEFVRAPEGQFSWSYFKSNFPLVLRLPGWDAEKQRLIFYTGETMAFWLINPMYIAIGFAAVLGIRKKQPLALLLPCLALVHLVFLCCHKTLGGWQFGNRYLVDMMPWLFYGLLTWMPEGSRFTRWSVPLLAWGAAINAIGAVATYNKWL